MKKYLTVFAAIFLFAILVSTPISACTYESGIDPQEFNKWTIESILFDHSRPDGLHLYIWLKNPNKSVKINRAILNVIKGFIIEYMYWNENNTSFCEVHRFKYNIKNDYYEEIKEQLEEWMYTL